MTLEKLLKSCKTPDKLCALRPLLDLIQDSIYFIDVKTSKIIYANKKAQEELQYSKEELLASKMYEINPNIKTQEKWDKIVDHLQKTKNLVVDIEQKRKDGTIFPVEVNMSYVKGKTDYLISIARNISERKKLEQKVLQSEKITEIGKLAGGLAHNINNLLAISRGYLDLMKIKKSLNNIDKVIESEKKIKNLISNIQYFAQNHQYEEEQLNINDILNDTLKMFDFSKQYKIKKHYDVSEPIVLGDEKELTNAFFNVLMNAKESMNSGEITIITDRKYIKDMKKNYIIIEIQDTGKGIKTNSIPKLFEPSYTTKPAKMLGLGLSAVYGMIERNNGHMEIESNIKGTNIKLYLPAEMKKTTEIKNDVLKGNGNILIIDDDELISELLELQLESLGYLCNTFNCPVDGLNYYKNNYKSINCITLDVIMPQMSGIELYQEIKKIKDTERVLFISGHTDKNIDKLLDYRTDYLSKPYSITKLSQKIKSLMNS